MQQLRRKATVLVPAAFLLASVSLLVLPASASAETKKVPCGGEVTATSGDEITGVLTKDVPLLGKHIFTFDLPTVTNSTGVLVGMGADLLTGALKLLGGSVCKVTVQIADTVKQAPVAGDTAGTALTKGAQGLNKTTNDAANTLNKTAPPSEPEQPQPNDPSSGDSNKKPDNEPSQHSGNDSSDDHSHAIAAPDSPTTGRGVLSHPAAALPASVGHGLAPMRGDSGLLFAMPDEFAPARGIRSGESIPGYQPQFTTLDLSHGTGGTGEQAQDRKVSNVGKATALPAKSAPGGNPASVPVLLAVIALAGSTAGLVRTWVLRKA